MLKIGTDPSVEFELCKKDAPGKPFIISQRN